MPPCCKRCLHYVMRVCVTCNRRTLPDGSPITSANTGRPLAQRLLADGEDVVDVPAKPAARARLFDTGHNRKTDAHDAHSVAVVAVGTRGLRVLCYDVELEALRMLVDRREELTRQRIQTVNRLQRLLAELTPGRAKKDITALMAAPSPELDDLRVLTAGIHPALLSDRGLVVAIQERAATCPSRLRSTPTRGSRASAFRPLPRPRPYFVVAEALTNAVKHSGAPGARVVLTPLPVEGLRVAVVDEGTGDASFEPLDHHAGRGLAGLRDRVEALGGTFMLVAVPRVGTTVTAELRPVAASLATQPREVDR